MGIFNEHSSNHQPFARGIQGAPGVGFNLTSTGDYDMVNKKLRNVGNPALNTDAATKKYVDDNSGGGKTSSLTIDSNIDMKDTYRILNLKAPSNANEPATKNYTDINFFYRAGSQPMTGNINMDHKKITNLGVPSNNYDAATKQYVDVHSSNLTPGVKLIGQLNANNKKIVNLAKPTNNNDAANKKYVDDNKVDGSVFLKLDGTRLMTGNLNMNNNRIFNIPAPNAPNQPTPLAYTDLAYLHVDGSNKMTNDLNINLLPT